jgi:hypothetical protein
MDYRKVLLEGLDMEIEVGVVAINSTSTFLSSLEVGSTLSRKEYEDFLMSSLIKDFNKVALALKKIQDEQEKKLLKNQLLEHIYKLNNKLKPNHIVLYRGKLLHRMDSIRAGGPSEPTITMNPGWLDAARMDMNVNSAPVRKLVGEIWQALKKDTARDFVLQAVGVLDITIPVLKLSSIKFNLNNFIVDFINKKCEGNVFVASADQRLWIGFVLAYTIPYIEKLIYVLNQNNYISMFTENIVFTQMYLAVLKINPELQWDKINWESYTSEDPEAIAGLVNDKDSKLRKISSRTTLNRGNKSSREEAEAEKPKFYDTAYEKILILSDLIKKRIIGQDKAVDSVCESISVARVGLRGNKRPIGSFLFAGKTGVGKTELSKVIADELADGSLIRIDCSEYQQAHEISKIFGAPPGYVGFEDDSKNPNQSTPPSTVSSKLKEKPFSVVLFDEIEKADPAIFNVLLQIMDEGHVTSGRGEVISFNNAVVILTSNIGTAEAEEICSSEKFGFGEDNRDLSSMSERAIKNAIKTNFKPEFRNRLTETIIFNGLSKDVCKGIVDVLLNKTKENLELAQHVTLAWDDGIREYILDDGYSEEFGAREIERTIQKTIELPLAKYILETKYINKTENALAPGTKIILSVKNDKLIFKEDISDVKEVTVKPVGISSSAPTARAFAK